MRPIKNSLTTFVLGAPTNWDEARHGICKPLYVAYDDDSRFYSYWKPTWRERIRVLYGFPVRLCVHSNGHPPVALDVTGR